MQITHYSNSFISVKTQEEHIVCDPWMGKANTGGWQSFPEYPIDQLASHLSKARFVYLSHLHDDHFHAESLKSLGLLDREFIIKRFRTPIMRNRLKKLGIKVIHELEPFAVYQFGSSDIAVFPQMTSNSSCLEDDIAYDLDTSIAFKANGRVFFNQVDNPLSTADLLQVRDWIDAKLGKIDIACLMSGAAGEYPHLFLGIDHIAEKKRIVDISLDKLMHWLRILGAKYYFPAGGTYIIPGTLSVFESNIAQPTYSEISDLINQLDIPVKMLTLEGGYSVKLYSDSFVTGDKPEVTPIESNIQAAKRMHSGDPYDYEIIDSLPIEEIIEMLSNARINWLYKINLDLIKITQSIRFEIYQDLVIKNKFPVQVFKLGAYQLFESINKDTGDLIIHIDHRALIGCLTRRFIWNGVLGSLCLFERNPNKHFPNDFFSINYLLLD